MLLDDLYIRESELALATLSQHSAIDIRLRLVAGFSGCAFR
jgi:hypothetical protein